MLTIEEIKNLSNYLLDAFKDVFATKEDITELKEQISGMQTSMDGFLKLAKDNQQELIVNGYRVDRLEKWAKRAGGKIDVKFET